MSLLSPQKRFDVLRMLAEEHGPTEVREDRPENHVQILRVKDGRTIRILKSHLKGSPTTRNETFIAGAMTQARLDMTNSDRLEFPELNVETGVGAFVTLSPRFEGIDLHDFWRLLKEHPQRNSPFLQLALCRGVLKSLQALHSRGFLHCDVRPDNYCISVKVASASGVLQVEPNFERIRAVDFGCSLAPPHVRKEQQPYFPFISGSAGYTSPDYDAARDVRGNPAQAANALAHLTPASDLWSLGFHVQRMLEKSPPDASVADGFGLHAPAAVELLLQLPARLGYPNGLPPSGTPIASPADGTLSFNVDVHTQLIKEIEEFTVLGWPFEPLVVAGGEGEEEKGEETSVVAPRPLPGPRPTLARTPVIASIALATVALAAGWTMWPRPGAQPQPAGAGAGAAAVVPAPAPAPRFTLADCAAPMMQLDAVLMRGGAPDADLQAKLRSGLDACRSFATRAQMLGDEARRVLVASASYALALGQDAEADQFARQLVARYPGEYIGYLITAKVRAGQRNAAATLEALALAADRGLTRAVFEDERPQFAFLAGNPALAAFERKLRN